MGTINPATFVQVVILLFYATEVKRKPCQEDEHHGDYIEPFCPNPGCNCRSNPVAVDRISCVCNFGLLHLYSCSKTDV
jgi:hypothetical protein